MSTQSYPPGPWAPPPPARRGMPKWVIALIIAGVLVFVVLPMVALVLAGLGLFHLFKPPAASDTPPKPDFQGFDVCSLITPRDAERAGARLINIGPEAVTVVGRVVETNEAGVPVDTCQYGTHPTSAADVKVSVTPVANLAAEDLMESRRLPVSGIGDEAYQVYGTNFGLKLIARKGTTQLTIETTRPLSNQDKDEADDHVRLVTDLGRKAVGKIPAKLELPTAVATGPCKSVDATAISGALGGPVAYSRSLDNEDATVCSYTAANGRGIVLRLQKEIDDGDREAAGAIGDPITIGGREAHHVLGIITFVGETTELEVDTNELVGNQPSEVYLKLAGVAADALLD